MTEAIKGFKLGIIGALVASLCCITPMVIFLSGLGTLAFALSFTKYKLFFTFLGIIFIGAAIMFNVRKKGSTCSIDKNEIRKKKLFITATVITMMVLYSLIQYLLLPYLGKMVYA